MARFFFQKNEQKNFQLNKDSPFNVTLFVVDRFMIFENNYVIGYLVLTYNFASLLF